MLQIESFVSASFAADLILEFQCSIVQYVVVVFCGYISSPVDHLSSSDNRLYGIFRLGKSCLVGTRFFDWGKPCLKWASLIPCKIQDAMHAVADKGRSTIITTCKIFLLTISERSQLELSLKLEP